MFKSGKNYKVSELPTNFEILGIPYTIAYHELPSEVDADKRASLVGQHDPWDRTIRIYYKNKPLEDVFITLLHEILHAIDGELEMDLFSSMGDDEEKSINVLALALFNVLNKNGWLNFPTNKK